MNFHGLRFFYPWVAKVELDHTLWRVLCTVCMELADQELEVVFFLDKHGNIGGAGKVSRV